MTATAILTTTGLVKRFGGVTGLDGADLELGRGEIVSLIGANGSGKSTLLDCISGFQRPDAGRVLLDGHDITSAPARGIARAGLRRTFQAVHWFAGFTAREHLELALLHQRGGSVLADALRTTRSRARRRDAVEQAHATLERVGLAHVAAHNASDLSYGQQKLLGLGTALVTSPSVLCLDEPLAGVSPRQTDALVEVLFGLRDAHQTVLLIEHNMDVVSQISDHIVVLGQGAVIAHGTAEEVRANEQVFAALSGTGEIE